MKECVHLYSSLYSMKFRVRNWFFIQGNTPRCWCLSLSSLHWDHTSSQNQKKYYQEKCSFDSPQRSYKKKYYVLWTKFAGIRLNNRGGKSNDLQMKLPWTPQVTLYAWPRFLVAGGQKKWAQTQLNILPTSRSIYYQELFSVTFQKHLRKLPVFYTI